MGRRLLSVLLKLRLNPLHILTPPRFRSISKFIHSTLEFYIFIVPAARRGYLGPGEKFKPIKYLAPKATQEDKLSAIY